MMTGPEYDMRIQVNDGIYNAGTSYGGCTDYKHLLKLLARALGRIGAFNSITVTIECRRPKPLPATPPAADWPPGTIVVTAEDLTSALRRIAADPGCT